MKDAQDAFRHFDGHLSLVADYGDMCEGHCLHTWDEGGRTLLRCNECGGYLLRQVSEFHGRGDSLYEDYFPVDSPEQAEELNRTLDGWQIEREFGRRYLMRDDLRGARWSRGRAIFPATDGRQPEQP